MQQLKKQRIQNNLSSEIENQNKVVSKHWTDKINIMPKKGAKKLPELGKYTV